MNLHQLTANDVTIILAGLKVINPIKHKELIEWITLQKEEQLLGGPWKARIREQGFVI